MKYYISKRGLIIIAEKENLWFLYCLKYARIRETEKFDPGFLLLNFKPNMNVYNYIGDTVKELKKLLFISVKCGKQTNMNFQMHEVIISCHCTEH